MPLVRPAMNIDPSPARGGGDISIVDDSALVPDEGPAGTTVDIQKPKSSQISLYVVREGDTIQGVAKLFGVTPNTVLWGNDLPRGAKLKVGQMLTILPVSGIPYTVKKGDTLASIAKKTGGDADEIGRFNDVDDDSLTAGASLIVPDGELSAPPAPVIARTSSNAGSTAVIASTGHPHVASSKSEPAHDVGPVGTAAENAYYMIPLSRYTETQGLHGFNAVDLAAPVGTPIMASASGDVIVAKDTGWNGGYGKYVVIQHNNNSQTLYGHQTRVIVSVGEHVVQGQIIGYVGSTGRSTGPHLHFEIRGGPRNPFAY